MRAAVVAALVMLADPAFAQTPPLTLPSRDVAVVYKADGAARDAIPGGIPETVRIAWSAARQSMRLQPEGRNQTLLVDLAHPSALLIDQGLHTAMDLPVRPKDLDPVKLRDAKLTRIGHEVVAGLACTDYAAESRRGHGTICLTDDGLALRVSGEINGRQGSFTALSVVYGHLPDAMFAIPPEYARFSLPGLSLPGVSRF